MYKVFKTETVAFEEDGEFLVNGKSLDQEVELDKIQHWLKVYMTYVEIDVENQEVDPRNEGTCQGLLMAMGYPSAHAREIVDVWKEQIASLLKHKSPTTLPN